MPPTSQQARVPHRLDRCAAELLGSPRLMLLHVQELATALLGKNWQPKAGLVNLEGKCILTLSDYRRKQGI